MGKGVTWTKPVFTSAFSTVTTTFGLEIIQIVYCPSGLWEDNHLFWVRIMRFEVEQEDTPQPIKNPIFSPYRPCKTLRASSAGLHPLEGISLCFIDKNIQIPKGLRHRDTTVGKTVAFANDCAVLLSFLLPGKHRAMPTPVRWTPILAKSRTLSRI